MARDDARREEELEDETSARRTAWEGETRAAERERKEQEEALKKQRQREIEDYEYKKRSNAKRPRTDTKGSCALRRKPTVSARSNWN